MPRSLLEPESMERKLGVFLEYAPDAMLVASRRGEIILANTQADTIFGYATGALFGRPAEILLPERFRRAYRGHRRRYFGDPQTRLITSDLDLYGLRKDGREFPVEISLARVEADEELFVSIAVRDITERTKADDVLRASEQYYRALYDDNPSMCLTVNSKGRLLSVNHSAAEQLGYTVEELVGKPLSALQPDGEKTSLRERLADCQEQPETVYRWEAIQVCKDESTIWVQAAARVIESVEGEPTVLIVCENVTKAHDLSEQLSHQATHDLLTGLVNRREFELRLQRVLETSQVEDTEHALCYIDLPLCQHP